VDLPYTLKHLDAADVELCEALNDARRFATDGTWQDCAESSEAEAARFMADLVELRGRLVDLQRTYFHTHKATGPTDCERCQDKRRDEQRQYQSERRADALRVLTLSPATRAWLEENDPKALEQALAALA
jgi:hypothetical protein